MKLLCEVCEATAATVYCVQDDASMCAACDATVHAANMLAAKHSRLALTAPVPGSSPASCDICQDKKAVFYCAHDRALLCRACDHAIHTANAAAAQHARFVFAGVRVALDAAVPTVEERLGGGGAGPEATGGGKGKANVNMHDVLPAFSGDRSDGSDFNAFLNDQDLLLVPDVFKDTGATAPAAAPDAVAHMPSLPSFGALDVSSLDKLERTETFDRRALKRKATRRDEPASSASDAVVPDISAPARRPKRVR